MFLRRSKETAPLRDDGGIDFANVVSTESRWFLGINPMLPLKGFRELKGVKGSEERANKGIRQGGEEGEVQRRERVTPSIA